MPQPRPVQVTMQAVPQGGAPPLPLRWAEAVRNVVEAQAGLEGLAAQLDGALFLDDEAWQQAVPHAQYTAALQVGAGLSPLRCEPACAAAQAWDAWAGPLLILLPAACTAPARRASSGASGSWRHGWAPWRCGWRRVSARGGRPRSACASWAARSSPQPQSSSCTMVGGCWGEECVGGCGWLLWAAGVCWWRARACRAVQRHTERARQLAAVRPVRALSSAPAACPRADELMRKDREIQELRAMVEALSLGGGVGGGSDAGGGGEGGGSESGGSEGGGSEARGSCMDGVP